MPITIRASVTLTPGATLYYDCPLRSDDYESEMFFEKHRGASATFVGYSEYLVGVLDYRGLQPGRYIDPQKIRVQFDGEDVRELNAQHFVLRQKESAQLVTGGAEETWIGDLPHPILFYPGDSVRFTSKPDYDLTDDVREVRQVFVEKPFAHGSIPRYEIMETETEMMGHVAEENGRRLVGNCLASALYCRNGWNTDGENIQLVSRGNVWALYNDISKLSFESDEVEAAFWAQDGISRYVENDVKIPVLGIPQNVLNTTFGLSLEDAHQLVRRGHAHAIVPTFNSPSGVLRYDARVLHDLFRHHYMRVRALTDRLWTHRINNTK